MSNKSELTAEDREAVQADLDVERQRLEWDYDRVPLPGMEAMRRGRIQLREQYIKRLERMLEDG